VVQTAVLGLAASRTDQDQGGRARFHLRAAAAQRRVVIDVVRLAAGRPTIHRLIEVDVTGLQERLAGRPIVGR
jgi:hypothetical protein